MLLTLNEVKDNLRYEQDDTSNDLILSSYILGIESAILKYVNKDVDIYTKPDIKVAALLWVGYIDMYRNADTPNPTDNFRPPYAVDIFLSPYKTPTII